MNRKIAPALLLAIFTLCASCAARINGSLLADGQADLNVYASLEPRMTMLIAGLAAASGAVQPGAPLLSGPSISASMSAAPGVASVSLANRTPAAVEGPVKISRLSDFLAPGGARGFITFEQGGPSQGGRCAIDISLDTGPEILSLMSPEIGDYLAALMAPLATGEKLTKTEYLALVSSIYSRGIADEIAGAAINASINLPGQVQSARGGTFSGRRAEFAIPLLDLLVLETPLSYEIRWR
ncbi:MAG: hypothetical protein LBQ69_05595 [Treponema sp.]|jgi:hypothetical protein|nr:hypothetical protein [Treponema sp.]